MFDEDKEYGYGYGLTEGKGPTNPKSGVGWDRMSYPYLCHYFPPHLQMTSRNSLLLVIIKDGGSMK
jgi:hypothetical protein